MQEVPAAGAVVITGASSGIGRATALRLARSGFRVYAGVRSDPDAESLRSEGLAGLAPLHLDVTDADALAAAADRVGSEVGERGLAGLVNNAGIGVGGPLEYIDLGDLRRQLEVNVVGPVAVTQAFLPLLRRGGGRVVMVGSISGRLAAPFAGPYAASKFALEALCDSLRVELAPWGLQVSLVEPGDIDTPIWDKTQRYADEAEARLPAEGRERYGEAIAHVRERLRESARNASPPSRCAEAIEHALTARRPRTRYLVGGDAVAQAWLARLLPDRLRDRLITRIISG